MSTENLLETNPKFIIACPHCMVCSIRLSEAEYAAVEAGQQMLNVCSVCDKEVVLNLDNV